MAEFLTDISLFSGTLANADVLHVVDVSDTSQNIAGSSYKLEWKTIRDTLLNNASTVFIPLAGSSVITGDLKYTKGSAANFGTADNYGLNLITNNTTKVTIDNAGFVGIGITTPNEILSINGNFRLPYDNMIKSNVGASENTIMVIDGVGGSMKFKKDIGSFQFYKAANLDMVLDVNSNFSVGSSTNAGTYNANFTIYGNTTAARTFDVYRNISAVNTLVFSIDASGNSSTLATSTSKAIDSIGTAGAGFVGIVAQSSNASAPAATGLKIFSASDGHLSWVVKNGGDTFVRKIGGTLTADRTYTLPDATDTIALIATTQTLTNKRVTQRVGTVASSATPTINTDNVDAFSITALAVAITSFTTNLSGTPTDYQTLMISITDDGTARSIAWGASFESSTTILPTITIISQRLDVAFVWNTVTSKWRCIGTS